MWKYYDIETLSDARESEKINALYPNPRNNQYGYKTDKHMIKAEKDKREGKCRLLVWSSDNPVIYDMTGADVEQIKIRYENAKMMAQKHKENERQDYTEYIFELGRAFALEGILRMLGFDYTEIATCEDIQWEV